MDVYIIFLMYTKALVLLVCTLAIVQSTHALYKRQSQHYCGNNLNQALMVICDGEYNLKRAQENKDSDWWVPEWTSENKDLQQEQWLPFMIKSNALHIINRKSRQTRGIVDECCHKTCTIDELKSYCRRS